MEVEVVEVDLTVKVYGVSAAAANRTHANRMRKRGGEEAGRELFI